MTKYETIKEPKQILYHWKKKLDERSLKGKKDQEENLNYKKI